MRWGARLTSNDAEFVRDLSQPLRVSNHWSGRIEMKLGMQVNWRALDNLELVGQVASRYHSDGSHNHRGDVGVCQVSAGGDVSLRAGRIALSS